MIFRGTSHYEFQKYTHITACLLEGGNEIQQQLRHQRVTVMCIKNGKYRMRVGLHGSVTVTAQTARKAIPCGASKHGIFSYSDSTYSVSVTYRASKHVIFHENIPTRIPRRNIARERLKLLISFFSEISISRSIVSR